MTCGATPWDHQCNTYHIDIEAVASPCVGFIHPPFLTPEGTLVRNGLIWYGLHQQGLQHLWCFVFHQGRVWDMNSSITRVWRKVYGEVYNALITLNCSLKTIPWAYNIPITVNSLQQLKCYLRSALKRFSPLSALARHMLTTQKRGGGTRGVLHVFDVPEESLQNIGLNWKLS